MSRKGINYSKVALAAESVKRRGKPPSLSNVCEELGILSYTTELLLLLEKWYYNQPEFQHENIASLSDKMKVDAAEVLEKRVELEKSLSLLRATLESTADGIMMVNGKGQVVDWNQKFVEMWRIPSHMLEVGTEKISFDYILGQLIHPEGIIADVEYLYKHPEWEGDLPCLYFKDGRIFERFTQPQRVGSEIVGRVYSFRDVTEYMMSKEELRIRERAIEASTHGVAIIDITEANQPIIYVNKSFERITGYPGKQVLGQNLPRLQCSKTDQVNQKRIELAIKEQREEVVEVESYRRNGEMYWCEISVAPVNDSFNKVSHYVCILNDITLRRKMEKQLVRQATHDALTELPNRILLMDRVEQAILLANKKKSLLAFLFLDLDRFKMTNDTLGHSVGDKLLQAVSNRLLVVTNEFDTVARVGGDEFVILLPGLGTEIQAQQIADEILHLIEKPFQVDQHNLKITGSIGICYYPKDGLDYETLMKNADVSMYHAKDSGRNTYRVFEEEMNSRAINSMKVDNALRDALKKKELFLVYQPIIDLKKNTLVGFEALLRWNSHLLGQVLPANFITMAEENGLIIDIGKWVLEKACEQAIVWHKKGYKNLSMAVNISGRQFRQANLPEIIEEALKNSRLPANYLELEFTESLLIEDVEHSIDTIHKLKDMGLKLVIDDFGTGYSSLSYLKQFSVNKLKIDRSFISELVNKENDAAIAKAIIDLGHSLNLEVLAEGVETEMQKDFILNLGGDYAQGYYFKPPSVPDDLKEFLKGYPNI